MPAGGLRFAAACKGWRAPLLALLLLASGGPGADEKAGHADEVKAAFVLNIARFVEWPAGLMEGSGRGLQLCLYRNNPLGSAIRTIRGKRVAGRELSIKTVYSAPGEQACNILFVPRGELERFSGESEDGAGLPLLTITDLTEDGGESLRYPAVLVFLVREGKRMGFEINLDAVERSGLRFSSELLKLGRIVGTP